MNNLNGLTISQWYVENLSTSHLIQTIQNGHAFTSSDWYTAMLLNINICAIFFIIRLFIYVAKLLCGDWIKNKRLTKQSKKTPMKWIPRTKPMHHAG